MDKDVFFSCKDEVMPLLDTSKLLGYLIKYDMIENTDSITLASPYLKSKEKEDILIKIAEEVGPKGFMLLYICLFESSLEYPVHKEAKAILGRKGKLI